MKKLIFNIGDNVKTMIKGEYITCEIVFIDTKRKVLTLYSVSHKEHLTKGFENVFKD